MKQKVLVAGLWAIPGIGPKTVLQVIKWAGGDLSPWALKPTRELAKAAPLLTHAKEIGSILEPPLQALGEQLLGNAERHHMKIAWLGEKEYPELLAQIPDPPVMLFYFGPGTDAPPRRRIAIVGTRRPDSIGCEHLDQLTREIVGEGIGVVSGAAIGIDQRAQRMAAEVGGETWGFLGSALDQIDPPQQRLWDFIRPKHGTIWSELPPGIRAEASTFPRRNRLISGASNAVLVMRANFGSGSMFTVEYAEKQERPVLAYPGDARNPTARLCNWLIAKRRAEPCLTVTDVMKAVGVSGWQTHKPKPPTQPRVDPATLPARTQAVFALVTRDGVCFDDLEATLKLDTGPLLTALADLIDAGLVNEHSARRYTRV